MITNSMFLNTKEKFTDDDKKRCLPTIQKFQFIFYDARSEGLLALEHGIELEKDPLLKIGLQLIVDVDGPCLDNPIYLEHIIQNLIVAEKNSGYELLNGLVILSGLLLLTEGADFSLVTKYLTSILGIEYCNRAGYYWDYTVMSKQLERFEKQEGVGRSEKFEAIINKLDGRTILSLINPCYSISANDLSTALRICSFDTVKNTVFNIVSSTGWFAYLLAESLSNGETDMELSLKTQEKIINVINEKSKKKKNETKANR